MGKSVLAKRAGRFAKAKRGEPRNLSAVLPGIVAGGERVWLVKPQEESEASLMKRIEVALAASGVLVWRNNVGLAQYKGAKVKYGLGNGSADLVGLVRMPDGVARFFGCEVKRKTGRVSEHQEKWIGVVRRWGGYVVIARSVEDALAGVKEAKAGVLQ